MMSIYGLLSLVLISSLFTACGVKGDPQVPIDPPFLGRIEKSQGKKPIPTNPKKKKLKSSEPDWEETDDFNEEKTQ